MRATATHRPHSATHSLVALIGFAAFLASVAFVRIYEPFGLDVVASAALIIGATTVAIFVLDLTWQKVFFRETTGLDFSRLDYSWRRTITKLLGLLATIGIIAVAYWVFPEYRNTEYETYFALVRRVVPLWVLVSLPYFFWVDAHMRAPTDGYWQMGRLVTFRWTEIDMSVLGQFVLNWTIKAYFLPLMFVSTCANVADLFRFDFSQVVGPARGLAFASHFLYFVDGAFAALGYVMSFRVTDTHVRSADQTILGWLVAIVCYEPFLSLLTSRYLPFGTGYSWDAWLGRHPALYLIWGMAIIAVLAVYTWSTVIFGARFSNLTHRGIITTGPYRWCKHPAYVTKSLFFWMTTVPFLPRGAWMDTVSRCISMIAINAIYVMRAKTEERHLARDPRYVQYALWIEQHGALRWIKRVPLLRLLSFRAAERVPID